MMFEDFDREFKKTSQRIWIGIVINAIVIIGLISFGIWVIVKIMAYFGII